MSVNKIVGSFSEAVADIHDESVILLGGFGPADGTPCNLIRALAKQGAKNLTIVANTPGHGRDIFEQLAAEGRLRILWCTARSAGNIANFRRRRV